MSNGPSETPVQSNRPVEEILMGGVKAAIWRNDTESGPRYNVTFERLYRDGKEWRSATSFGRDDLLLLGKVADQAHTWIMQTKTESRAPDRAKSDTEGEPPRLANAAIPRRR